MSSVLVDGGEVLCLCGLEFVRRGIWVHPLMLSFSCCAVWAKECGRGC